MPTALLRSSALHFSPLFSVFFMSLNQIPSLKSSEGSKSTTAHLAGGEARSFFLRGEPSRALCASSWINRLHPRLLSLQPPAPPPPPPHHLPAADPRAPLDVVAISSNEFRTRASTSNLGSSFVDRRYFNLFNRAAAVPPRQSAEPPRIVLDGGVERSVSGFGPFQVRSRNAALTRGELEALGRRANGSRRVLGRDSVDEVGGCFPLFRRMAHIGERLNGERANHGSHAHRQLESLHSVQQVDNWKAFFPSTRMPQGRNQDKLSPFFDSALIGRNKGIIGHATNIGKTKSLEYRSQRSLKIYKNGHSSLPLSYLPPQESIDESQGHLAINPWRASASEQYAARGRSDSFNDAADEDAPIRTYCDLHVLHQNTSVNHLESATVRMNEPAAPTSVWNMKRFKRSSNFDNIIPSKFRKLGNED